MLQNNQIDEVNKIVKYFNSEVKIEVTKFNYLLIINNPITSDIIKIFYIDKTILKVQTILINLNSVK